MPVEALEVNKKPTPLWRIVLNMMLNPSAVLKQTMNTISWKFSIGVSILAFLLLFLQTGLDLYKTGQKEASFAALIAMVVGLYGLIVIPFLGVVIWGVSKIFKCEKDIKWTISAICLSYSGALIYCIVGICFSMFLGWRTTIAFGITGVIWATGPMMATIREMTGGKILLSILLSTFISVIVLYTWSLIGGI